MKLNFSERFKLLDALPKEEDMFTIKLMRKLKETLSPSEEEWTHIVVTTEYMCPYRGEDPIAKREECDNRGFFREQPTCGKHDLLMVATGGRSLYIPPEYVNVEKEIHMGTKAKEIASAALKRLNDQKKLTEAHESLYDKFFPPDEEEKEG